jgi:hypothetical protein
MIADVTATITVQAARKVAKELAAKAPYVFGPANCTHDELTDAILRWYKRVFGILEANGYHYAAGKDLWMPYLVDDLADVQGGK